MRRLASNVSNNLRLIPQLFVSPLALLGTHDVNSDMNHKFANRMLWNEPSTYKVCNLHVSCSTDFDLATSLEPLPEDQLDFHELRLRPHTSWRS